MNTTNISQNTTPMRAQKLNVNTAAAPVAATPVVVAAAIAGFVAGVVVNK